MVDYAELHCHSNFSFLDGASAPDELAERAVELGLAGLGITDHQGLYGVVRAASAYEEVGLRPILGVEVELRDPIVDDPDRIVVPARRSVRRGGRRKHLIGEAVEETRAREGEPDRPRPERARLPGHREAVKEDQRGIGERQRGPHLVLLARDAAGYRSLCRLVSRANLAGTKAMPRFDQARLAEHTEGLVALSGCREGEIARRLLAGDRAGARAAAAVLAERYGRDGFHLELSHHRLPDDDWLVTETAALADELGLPVVVTNDVHYARPEGREFQDVLTAIRHGRTLDDARGPAASRTASRSSSRREEMLALPPGDGSLGRDVARAWSAGIGRAADLAAACRVDLGFEQYRFPGFPVPPNETPFSYLSELCWAGAKRRYHPLTCGGGQPARPRARRDRAGRPRRVLPDLLGPDALREGAGNPGAGPGQRDELDRVVHARDQPGRADRATTCCSSGSSTRAGRPTRTSTSTSAPRGARRSSSTSTTATAPSTRGWSATS